MNTCAGKTGEDSVMDPNIQANRAGRWLISLAVVLLLVQTGFAAEKKGEFFGAMETEYPDWFKESFLELEEDVQEAGEAGRRVMLFFHQAGCPYCNLLVERNLSIATWPRWMVRRSPKRASPQPSVCSTRPR
jgi:hypothetical protein